MSTSPGHPPLLSLIFDCDGTLVDSEAIHARAVIAAYRAHGVEESYFTGFAVRFMGHTLDYIHPRVMAETGLATAREDISRHIHAHTRQQLATGAVPASPGCHGALAALEHHGPMAVASNGHREVVLRSLRDAGLAPWFPPGRVFTKCQVDRPKPFPDVYLLAASALDAIPARCVVIEDSAAGVTAGKAAGMTVLGYTGLALMPDAEAHLLNAGADHVFSDYSALPALLAALAERRIPEGSH
jgi:HAD superfamily hydrolase (TIGR01509 family)